MAVQSASGRPATLKGGARDERTQQGERSENASQGQEREEGQGQSGLHRVAQSVPYALGGLVLILYFVWMCIEMSNHANGGGALPLGIFGGAILGALAGGASVLSARRRKD